MKKIIPDCYWPNIEIGEYVSHETICVVNPHTEPATVRLTLYFEDREKVSGYSVTVPPERAKHIRMDALLNHASDAIPHNVPYAVLVECNLELPVQYTRVDAARPGVALMTTMV